MRRCELAISDVEVSATNTACIDLDPYLIAAKRRRGSSVSRRGVAEASRTIARIEHVSGERRDWSKDALREFDEAVRVAPLVVVPGDDLHQRLVDHGREGRVEDRRERRPDNVGGDERRDLVGGDVRQSS